MATIIDDCVVMKMSFVWIIVGISGPDLLAAISTPLETFWMALLASFECNCGDPTLATFLKTIDKCLYIDWEDLRELLPLTWSTERAERWTLSLKKLWFPMMDSGELLVVEKFWCMEEFEHSMVGLMRLGHPTIRLMECWLPTLGLGRLGHLALG